MGLCVEAPGHWQVGSSGAEKRAQQVERELAY